MYRGNNVYVEFHFAKSDVILKYNLFQVILTKIGNNIHVRFLCNTVFKCQFSPLAFAYISNGIY